MAWAISPLTVKWSTETRSRAQQSVFSTLNPNAKDLLSIIMLLACVYMFESTSFPPTSSFISGWKSVDVNLCRAISIKLNAKFTKSSVLSISVIWLVCFNMLILWYSPWSQNLVPFFTRFHTVRNTVQSMVSKNHFNIWKKKKKSFFKRKHRR